MAKYVCPCCGRHFNGKKCRNCYYETFNSDIKRTLHIHQEANAPDPVRPTSVQLDWERQKRVFRENQARKRNQKQIPKWMFWLLVFFLLEPLLLIAGEAIDELGSLFETSIVAATREAEPEPEVVLPPDASPAFSAEGLTIYVAETGDGYSYPVYLENNTERDLTLSSQSIAVEGFLSEQSSLYCQAQAGTLSQGALYLEQADMVYATMDIPGQITVGFNIYDMDSYEDIVTGQFYIGGEVPTPIPAPAGEVLLDNGSIQIRSLGYEADEYDPGAFSEGVQLFYVENFTDSTLSIYAENILMDGEKTSLSLWTKLPPGCRTVTRMWLYSLDELDVYSLEDAQPLELDMVAFCEETGELTELGTVTLNFF